MKINRVATETLAPEWVFSKDDSSAIEKAGHITMAEADGMKVRAGEPSDESMVAERERIEVCASSHKDYHCNARWSDSVKSQLREYSIACGMSPEKFKVIDYQEIITRLASIQSDVGNATMVRTASKSGLVIDAFKIEEKAKTDHMDVVDWQSNKSQLKLSEKPTLVSNSVRSLRGGENYFENSDTKTARGQNSITNPNAIEEFSKTEDSGDLIKKQVKARKEERAASNKNWQDEKIKSMAGSEIIPKGKVFMTEDMNAQSGIGSSDGIKKYHGFGVEGLPEKTAGEQLSGRNESRRKSIQRNVEKAEWQFVQSESTRVISDDFTESLKKLLKK